MPSYNVKRRGLRDSQQGVQLPTRNPVVTGTGSQSFTMSRRAERFQQNLADLAAFRQSNFEQEMRNKEFGLREQELGQRKQEAEDRAALDKARLEELQTQGKFERGFAEKKFKEDTRRYEEGVMSKELESAANYGQRERELAQRGTIAEGELQARKDATVASLANNLIASGQAKDLASAKIMAAEMTRQAKGRETAAKDERTIEQKKAKVKSALEAEFRKKYDLKPGEPILGGKYGAEFADALRNDAEYQTLNKQRSELQVRTGERPAPPSGGSARPAEAAPSTNPFSSKAPTPVAGDRSGFEAARAAATETEGTPAATPAPVAPAAPAPAPAPAPAAPPERPPQEELSIPGNERGTMTLGKHKFQGPTKQLTIQGKTYEIPEGIPNTEAKAFVKEYGLEPISPTEVTRVPTMRREVRPPETPRPGIYDAGKRRYLSRQSK